MTPDQRTAALRLISAFDDESISRINDLVVLNDAIELLRELASAPQRKPLSSVVLVGLWGPRSDGPDNSEIVSFARLIEKAHGIGEAA